jgi:hypothetical protein
LRWTIDDDRCPVNLHRHCFLLWVTAMPPEPVKNVRGAASSFYHHQRIVLRAHHATGMEVQHTVRRRGLNSLD